MKTTEKELTNKVARFIPIGVSFSNFKPCYHTLCVSVMQPEPLAVTITRKLALLYQGPGVAPLPSSDSARPQGPRHRAIIAMSSPFSACERDTLGGNSSVALTYSTARHLSPNVSSPYTTISTNTEVVDLRFNSLEAQVGGCTLRGRRPSPHGVGDRRSSIHTRLPRGSCGDTTRQCPVNKDPIQQTARIPCQHNHRQLPHLLTLNQQVDKRCMYPHATRYGRSSSSVPVQNS